MVDSTKSDYLSLEDFIIRKYKGAPMDLPEKEFRAWLDKVVKEYKKTW